MTELSFMGIVLLVNLATALLYLLISFLYSRQVRRDRLIRFTVMLMCPVVAEACFLFGWLWFRVFFHREVDLADVVFSKDREKTYRKADEMAESNLVPVEEALAVTDRASTRVLVLDVVRRDISKALRTISLTLKSDDSEVSHYGASVLQNVLNDFYSNVGKLDEAVREGEKNKDADTDELVQNERTLFETLDKVLVQRVLPDEEQKRYVLMMEETAVFLSGHTLLTAQDMSRLCGRLLETGETDLCGKWADLCAQTYPDAAVSYTNRMKLYYSTGDRKAFFETLNELKSSSVTVDHDTLEIIRLFNGGKPA